MRFDDRFIDELKSRLRASEVIGRTVKLKRAGREWVGLSPFGKEKTPSFYVNDDKQFFHDFSSGKSGDVITFLQETERLSFVEAVERLAAEAGMPLPAADPHAAETEKKRATLQDWLEGAAKLFEQNLRAPKGAAARKYLLERGLPEDQWARFRLGYAPADRTGLLDALVQRGAKPGELVEAGLLIAPEGGGRPFDRFRDRIMFPIADARGRIVSFGGRALNPEDKAKYLNGPETPLFHKGRVLYGLPDALKIMSAASSGGQGDPPIVVVEGYMDAIACQRAGIAGVAPLGTALTEEQIDALWRRCPEPVLCFDGDKAGQKAAYRAIDRALPLLKAGRSLRFCLLTSGKDPDEVLRKEGATALKAALSETLPFVDLLWKRESEAEPLDTPERRAGLKKRLREAASAIPDKDLSEQYRADLFARFDALTGGAPKPAWEGPRRPARGRDRFSPGPLPPSPEGKAAAERLNRRMDPLAAALAQGVLDDPERIDPVLEALGTHGFLDPRLDDLAKEIIRLRLIEEALDKDGLARHLARSGLSALLSEVHEAARLSGAPFLAPEATLADARTRWSQAYAALTRLSALDRAIASGKVEDLIGTDPEAFRRLKTERDALKRAIKTGTIWEDGGS